MLGHFQAPKRKSSLCSAIQTLNSPFLALKIISNAVVLTFLGVSQTVWRKQGSMLHYECFSGGRTASQTPLSLHLSDDGLKRRGIRQFLKLFGLYPKPKKRRSHSSSRDWPAVRRRAKQVGCKLRLFLSLFIGTNK